MLDLWEGCCLYKAWNFFFSTCYTCQRGHAPTEKLCDLLQVFDRRQVHMFSCIRIKAQQAFKWGQNNISGQAQVFNHRGQGKPNRRWQRLNLCKKPRTHVCQSFDSSFCQKVENVMFYEIWNWDLINDVFESVHLNGWIDSKRPLLLGIFCLHLGATTTNGGDQDSPRRGYYKDWGVT